MNPPERHDGLSAFFDGELPPTEEREVQSHLHHSSPAQNELAEIRRLSEEIRNLPAESAPEDLLANVLTRIKDQPESSAQPPADSLVKTVGKTGSWIAVAIALVVLLAWLPALWDSTTEEQTSQTIASHSQESAETEQTTSPAMPAPQRPAEGLSDKELAQADSASEGEMPAPKHQPQRLAKNSAAAPAADQLQADVAKNQSLKLQAKRRRDSKDRVVQSDSAGAKSSPRNPQVGEVLDLTDQPPDEVVVVELTVANAADSRKHLQRLLAGNQVSPANFDLRSSRRSQAGNRIQSQAEHTKEGLFVQSSREQLLATLTAFRGEQAVSNIRTKTTVALNQLPLENWKPARQNRRESAEGFGGALTRSLQMSRTRQRGPAKSTSKPESESQAPKIQRKSASAPPKPAEAKKSPPTKSPPTKSPPTKSPPANTPAPSLSAPNAAGLSLGEAADRQKSDSGQAPAFQMLVQTPDWEKLARSSKPQAAATGAAEPQKPAVEKPPAKSSHAEEEEAPSRPVRVLFIFREEEPRKP